MAESRSPGRPLRILAEPGTPWREMTWQHQAAARRAPRPGISRDGSIRSAPGHPLRAATRYTKQPKGPPKRLRRAWSDTGRREPAGRIELPAGGLRNHCSTAELRWPNAKRRPVSTGHRLYRGRRGRRKPAARLKTRFRSRPRRFPDPIGGGLSRCRREKPGRLPRARAYPGAIGGGPAARLGIAGRIDQRPRADFDAEAILDREAPGGLGGDGTAQMRMKIAPLGELSEERGQGVRPIADRLEVPRGSLLSRLIPAAFGPVWCARPGAPGSGWPCLSRRSHTTARSERSKAAGHYARSGGEAVNRPPGARLVRGRLLPNGRTDYQGRKRTAPAGRRSRDDRT